MPRASKKIFAGILTCAVLSGFILGLYAESNKTTIEAILNNSLKLKLNGADWSPKDPSTGENYSPITYNGRTYLPVRAVVTDAAGMPVEFDASTDTVWIGGKSDSIQAKDRIYYEEYYGTSFTTDSPSLTTPLKNFNWGVTNDKEMAMQYFSFALKPEGKFQNLRTSFYIDPDVREKLTLNICKDKFNGEIIKTVVLEPGKLLENVDMNISGTNLIYLSANIGAKHGTIRKIIVGEPVFYNGALP